MRPFGTRWILWRPLGCLGDSWEFLRPASDPWVPWSASDSRRPLGSTCVALIPFRISFESCGAGCIMWIRLELARGASGNCLESHLDHPSPATCIRRPNTSHNVCREHVPVAKKRKICFGLAIESGARQRGVNS